MARRPKGYGGKGHETIGSDILAVSRALQAMVEGDMSIRTAQRILGPAHSERLAKIEPNSWYPIQWLMELLELVHTKLGSSGLRKVGRTLFRLSHEQRVMPVAKSARDIVYGIDGMYHHANRGQDIGGWEVLRFEPGYAELAKTTPHLCYMEEGILSEALGAIGVPTIVSQEECFREGAGACKFVLQSSEQARKWTG